MDPQPRALSMNKSVCSALLMLLAALSQAGATTNLYINSSPLTLGMTPPQIDARAWYNRALFEVASFTSLQALPFESENTLFFTNAPSPAGTMSGDPGFRFFENAGTKRYWMDSWVNRG